LFWTIAIAVAAQAALLLFERYAMPDLHDPEYDHRDEVLRQALADNPGRPLVLVLGSSRVALGLQPRVIEKWQMPTGEQPFVFNFSIPGSGSLRELIWLKRLLHEGIHPDRVLLECWPPLITGDFGDKETAFVSGNSLRLDDLWVLRGYACEPMEMFDDWLTARTFPCYGDRAALLARLAPTWLPPSYTVPDHMVMRQIDCFGALPTPDKPPPQDYRRRLLASDRQAYGDKIAHWRLSETSERAIRATLDLCRFRGIPAALLLMPESSEMLDWYSQAARAELEQFLDRLRSEDQAALVDTRHWITSSDFFDSHHLARDGAEAFTRRFGREVLPRLFMKGPNERRTLLASGSGRDAGGGRPGNN
jgi:hypothetical protein